LLVLQRLGGSNDVQDAAEKSRVTADDSCVLPRRSTSYQTLMMDLGNVSLPDMSQAETLIQSTARAAGFDFDNRGRTCNSIDDETSQRVLLFTDGVSHLMAYTSAHDGTVSVDMHTTPHFDVYPFIESMAKAFHVPYDQVLWKSFQRMSKAHEAAAETKLGGGFFHGNDVERLLYESQGNVYRRRLFETTSKYQNIQVNRQATIHSRWLCSPCAVPRVA
jgi:hypothetical protein